MCAFFLTEWALVYFLRCNVLFITTDSIYFTSKATERNVQNNFPVSRTSIERAKLSESETKNNKSKFELPMQKHREIDLESHCTRKNKLKKKLVVFREKNEYFY